MSELRWRRVLIAGAAGRIGACLRAGLVGRHDSFRLFDRRRIAALRRDEAAIAGDLTDTRAVAHAVEGCDALIHLAGAADPRDFSEMFRTNLEGAFGLLEAARRAGVKRIVFASSNHVYGMYPVAHSMRLVDPPRPDSFYGVTKSFGETLLRYYHDKHGIESVSLRIGSFVPFPTEQRHLSTWLSPRDCAALVQRALVQPGVGAAMVVGMSNNRRIRIAEPNWESIGYVPQDDAEIWREELTRQGVDTDGALRWSRHGGSYEAFDH